MIHTRLLPTVSALALCLAAPAFADETRTVWRVFIGDHTDPKITAFDLDAPDTRWTFDTVGQSKFATAANGATIIAVQSDSDQVNVLRSGVDLSTHGDHSDLEVEDPSAIDTVLHGPRPFHVVSHDGVTTINYDEGGYAEMLSDDDLKAGEVAPVRFDQSFAHHGFVTPMGDVTLSTVTSGAAPEGGTAPTRLGLQAFDKDGRAVGDLAACSGIHGEAFSGAYLAAGCTEGVLTVREGDGGPAYSLLAYPEDLPEGKTGTLLGGRAMQVFLGNYGAAGLVVIDPEDEPHFKHIELPFRRVDFVLDPVKPQLAYVLTEDGSLHRVNMLSAKIEQSARITAPYSMDGHWNDARPRLAVAGDEVLVTDPVAHALHVIAADTLEEARSIPVNGTPFNIVAVGGTGLEH